MKKKGFTLIEIITVIALISILFVIFIPRIDFATERVREVGVQNDMRSYQIAIEQVAREHNGFSDFVDD